MAKIKKLIRKNFRFTQQIADMLQQAAEDLDKSENEVVELALFEWLSERKNFIIDPDTDRPIYVRAEIVESEDGLTPYRTKDGGTLWIDNDTHNVVKRTKKA